MALAYATLPELSRNQDNAIAIAQIGRPLRAFANFPFGRLKPEAESPVFTPQRKTDTKLERIVEAWKRFETNFNCNHIQMKDPSKISEPYRIAQQVVSGIHCSSNDFKAFLMCFPELARGDIELITGIFLSALINDGAEEEYIMDVRDFSTRRGLDYLCYANRKNVVITGNAGWELGTNMESGTVVVKGSTGIYVGRYMKGGKIIIEQNANLLIGYDMSGGEIHIHGRCVDLIDDIGSTASGGKIFLRGVQVYPPQVPEPASGLGREVV